LPEARRNSRTLRNLRFCDNLSNFHRSDGYAGPWRRVAHHRHCSFSVLLSLEDGHRRPCAESSRTVQNALTKPGACFTRGTTCSFNAFRVPSNCPGAMLTFTRTAYIRPPLCGVRGKYVPFHRRARSSGHGPDFGARATRHVTAIERPTS